jgi:hypothetical protein
MSNMQAQANLYFCQMREFAIGGHVKMVVPNLKGPTSYETGGVKVDPQLVGAGTKGKIIWIGSVLTDSGTYDVRFKAVSLTEVRLVWTVRATGAEVANATDLSAQTLHPPVMFLP